MSKWVSVKNRLPECDKTPDSLGVPVLIYPPFGGGNSGYSEVHQVYYGRRVTNEPQFYIYGAVVSTVTHWMSIPEPPAKKGEK